MESLQVRGGAHMWTGIFEEHFEKQEMSPVPPQTGGRYVVSGGGTPPVQRWVGPLQDPRHA